MTELLPPETADFPINWQEAEDEQKFWSFYGNYMPEPFTPIERDIITAIYATSWNKAFAYFQVGQSQTRFFNGYYYEGLTDTPTLSAADVETLKKEKITPLSRQYLTQNLPDNVSFEAWEEAWLAEVKQHLTALDNLNLAQPLPQLLDCLAETLRRYGRISDLHAMQFPILVMIVHEFEQFYQDLFGQEGLSYHQLLHKNETHAVRGNRQLWRLSRQISQQPTIKELFLTASPDDLMNQLSATTAGQAILTGLNDYLSQHGKQSELMLHVCYPSWREDPAPVILNLKAYLTQSERDFEAELNHQHQHQAEALAAVRAQLATYPEPVREQFETLLPNAQKAAYMLDEHTYWMELAPNYHARQVLLPVGRALQSMGCIAHHEDIFHLHLAEIHALAENPTSQESLITARKAELAHFKQLTPPPFLGDFPTEMPPANLVMDILYATLGMPLPPSEIPNMLVGYPASSGIVIGPVKILHSINEVAKLTPGDILVTSMTTPVWTPAFAHAAGVITDSGGMLSHPAIVAREMGIPAVVGTGTATFTLQDGQMVELNGTTGQVKIL